MFFGSRLVFGSFFLPVCCVRSDHEHDLVSLLVVAPRCGTITLRDKIFAGWKIAASESSGAFLVNADVSNFLAAARGRAALPC